MHECTNRMQEEGSDELLLGQHELSGSSLELLLADRLRLGRRVRLLSVFECGLAALAPQLERFRGLAVAVLLANNNALTDLRPLAEAWGGTLTRLYVASNALTTAEGLQRLPLLQRADLSRNRLAELPEPLPAQLERLDVHGNELASLPSSLSLLSRLERLGLHGNRPLRQLPPLAALGRLTHLSCSFCGLARLEALPLSLESLRCEGNRLTALELAALPALRRLEARDNRLPALDVSACAALQTLGCADNRLARPPEGLLRLPLLRSVALAGNPELPDKIRADWAAEEMPALREALRLLERVEEARSALAQLQQQL